MGFIHLLPALPDVWEEGTVNGLCAKGGFEVSIKWKEGKLAETIIKSNSGEPCWLRYGDEELLFNTKKGDLYRITVKNGALKSEKVK